MRPKLPKVVHAEPSPKTPKRFALDVAPTVEWTVIGGLGLAVAVIGWTDLALLWYPVNFGSAEWEFGTISAHLDGMPLATVGFALALVGVLNRGWRIPARALALVSFLISVALFAMYLIYLLDVPIALRGVQAALQPTIKRAIVKATVFALTYMALYAWLGWYVWRKTRGRSHG